MRGLMPFFFSANIMKKSNFDGTTVLSKDVQITKDRLDRRLLMSMLVQVLASLRCSMFLKKRMERKLHLSIVEQYQLRINQASAKPQCGRRRYQRSKLWALCGPKSDVH